MRMEFIPPRGGIDFIVDKQKKLYKNVRAYHRGSAGPRVKRDLTVWTRGWATKVNFVQVETITTREISVLVFPRGKGRQKWIWVSGGVRQTKPKTAKTAKGMNIYQYGPRTLPGPRVGPGTGRARFARFRGLQTVKPTVIKAREFEKSVVKKFSRTYNRAILGIIKASFR